jgi:hypothetical protein
MERSIGRPREGAWHVALGVFIVTALVGLVAVVAVVAREDAVDVGSAGTTTAPLMTATTIFHGPDPTAVPPSSSTSSSTSSSMPIPETRVTPPSEPTTTRAPITHPSTTPPPAVGPMTTATSPPAEPPSAGFVTLVGVALINPNLVIRFRGDVPAAVRADVEAVRLRINALSGARWRVGSPTSALAARNELAIGVGPPTQCAGLQPPGQIVYACTVRAANAAIVSADVEINPLILGTPVLLTTVLHEMGHATGLNDFDARFLGRWQLMRTECVAGLFDYEAGDEAGLRWLGRSTS